MSNTNILHQSLITTTPARFTTFAGVTAIQGTTAPASDLPSLFDTARPATTSALGALIRGDRAGYDSAKRTLPMLAAGHFDGPRAAANVTGFQTCFVEFDALTAPLTRVWPDLLADLPEVEGLLAAFATGRGIRFMFHVPEVEAHAAELTRELYKQVWQHVADLLVNRWPELGPPDVSSAKVEQLQAAWNRPDLLPYLNVDAPALPFEYDVAAAREGLSKPLEPARPHGADAGTRWLKAAELNELKAVAERLAQFDTLADMDAWKAFTAALANTYGPAAEDVAVAFARKATGYNTARDERATRKLYRSVLAANTYAGRRAGFGTIAYLLATEGVRLKTATLAANATPAATETETVLTVNRYATERAAEFAELVANAAGAVLLTGATGAGKTRLVADWLKSHKYEGAQVGLLILPTQAAAESLATREGIPYIKEGITAAEVGTEFDAGARVFATTYDGLLKATNAGLVPLHVAVDEWHGLPNAQTYRRSARAVMPLVRTCLGAGGRAVLMTATPTPELVALTRADEMALTTVRIETKTEPERVVYDGVGGRADLVAYVADWVRAGKRVLVHVDRKADERNRRGVWNLVHALRAAGVIALGATADAPQGLADFQGGKGAVLVGTNIIAAALDVPAEGGDVVAVHVATQGVDVEALTQLGGRFRAAKRVSYVAWAWGKGAYLDDYSKRVSAPAGAASFDWCANLNRVRAEADRTRAATKAREWHRSAPLGGGRLTGVSETADGTVERDTLAIAHAATTDRHRLGGMAAALEAMRTYLPDVEYRGSLLNDDDTNDNRTEFDVFSTRATAARAALKPADLLAYVLARAAKAGGETATQVQRLADRWCLTVGTDPLAVLAVALVETGYFKRAELPDLGDYLGQWAEGWAGAADTLYGLLNDLPRTATRTDALALCGLLLADGVSASKARRLRTRWATSYLLAGGVTADIPAHVVADIGGAGFIELARIIRDALPELARRTSGVELTAAELAALVRELTGTPHGRKATLRALRAVADVQQVTGTAAGGQRTTLYVLGAPMEWGDFGQSYSPRQTLAERIERAAERIDRETAAGAPPPPHRIFRLCKGETMHGAASTPLNPPKPPDPAPWWDWLGAPPPETAPF